MRNNIKMAKDLVRIAKMLLAFSRNELEKQLKQMNIPKLNIEENLECLEKMNAKEQKAALFWIKKKSLVLPEDLSKFNDAMNLINKQHLDFQNFECPMDVINRDDKSTVRIKSQDAKFNPDTEPAFTNKKTLKNGVTVYYVEDSRKGQIAVRKAIDVNWGYDKNPWCLIIREFNFNQQKMNRLTEEQKEEMGLYGDELDKEAWQDWNAYNKYPKRIAFQNGKLLALCASRKDNKIEWWDKNNKSSSCIPGLDLIDDDMEFLMKYGKTELSFNKNTPVEILEELADDEDNDIRRNVAENPSTPVEMLVKLADDEYSDVREKVAENPNAPVETLVKLADDDFSVKGKVAKNPSTPVETLVKLADDDSFGIQENIALNPRTPAEILVKLANNWLNVRKNVARNPNTPVATLEKLADDEYSAVREVIAENPSTPIKILVKLADDKNPNVREYIARNPNTPVAVLEKLAKDEYFGIKQYIAGNPKTPAGILEKMADDKSNIIRYCVVCNPNTPIETLKKLANDEDDNIRNEAERKLEK